MRKGSREISRVNADVRAIKAELVVYAVLGPNRQPSLVATSPSSKLDGRTFP
jgi:hypothetical protein